MYKLMLMTFIMACFSSLNAQATAARVIYEESTALDFSGKEIDPGMKALFSQLPDAINTKSELLFNESAALYSNKKDPTDDFSAAQGDHTITFKISEGEPDVFYSDLETNTTKQKRKVFDRSFQIEDIISPINWTLVNEQSTDEKTTLPVKKAIGLTTQGDTLTAWYTNSIPVSTGPKTYGGLPGLIIRLVEGNKTYQALKIDLLSERPEIPLPFEGGKTISIEKFYEIEKKKMDAFQRSGNVRVMTFGG